jgi:ubiquinone biosynthesis protein COQ4
MDVGTAHVHASIVKAFHRYAKAIKHFILLIIHPEQRLYHGVQFLSVTEGRSFERSFAAFHATARGRHLLETRPVASSILEDRLKLQAAAPRSLGRCYFEFMTSNGLDEGLYLGARAASTPQVEGDIERDWYRARIEGSHDVRHVLTGYGPEPLGEVCLLSFRFGQHRHPGLFMLTVLGCLHPKPKGRDSAFRAIVEAFRRGRNAALVDLLPWEEGLDAPLCVHRATLRLAPPKHYSSQVAPQAYSEFQPEFQRAKTLAESAA